MTKLIAVVGIALTGLVSCGHHTKLARYQDPRDGWTISYPASMHRSAVDQYQAMVSWRGVVVANSDRIRAGEPGYFRRFPPDGVAFGLIQREGGPAPELSPPEARFPLSRSDFAPERGAPPPTSLFHGMIANGAPWQVIVWFGPKASRADKEKTWRIVESIRFPPQRTGTMSGAFYVLEDASHYALGSVTRFPGRTFPGYLYVPPFFLLHAPGGFYAVAWKPEFEPKCKMQLDRAQLEFYCGVTHGRWDRMGRPIVKVTRPYRRYNNFLDQGQAKVGRDGQVLVGNWSNPGFANEKRLWPSSR
jgi:hypothetical protein